MIYFYCCEATTSEGAKKKVDGYAELCKKIKKESELKEVQETVRQKIRHNLHQAEPYMNWQSASIVFLALNPL